VAKLCLYCGRPLAKDDARFCNDCGRSQVTSVNADPGAAAPSAIKVKLPPKEYARDDSSSLWPETNLPGSAASATPLAPPRREPTIPPSARMPKRPTRLAPQEPTVLADKADPVGDTFAATARPASSVPAPQPTPAEEASTMVLPNWREELAQLRKEQERAKTDTSAPLEKKAEKATQEPPPLPPRRAPNTPLPLSEKEKGSSQSAQPRSQVSTPSDLSSSRAQRDNTRSAEQPRQGSYTLPPLEKARPAQLPRRVPNTPQPAPSTNSAELLDQASHAPSPGEKARPTEASRRELRVKVWEQEATIQPSQVQKEKQEPGPAPAVEQNPLASVAFGAEEQGMEIEELETVDWSASLSPIPASPEQPLSKEERQKAREEKRSLPKEAGQTVREEKRPMREERRASLTEESRQPVKNANSGSAVKEDESDIEDLPTVPLAVPEAAKQDASIKIERFSTPAPKKWAASPVEDVEDLPTRPMAASSVGHAAPPSPQSAAAQQTPNGELRPEAGQAEVASPAGQRVSNPLSAPGVYASASAAQLAGQAAEIAAEPLAPRARPVNPHSQSGITFDPASLPPLPPGPLPAPGNVSARPEIPGSQRPQPRPAQRPPSFDPSPESLAASKSASPNSSKPTAEGKKLRKKRRTGRLVAIVLLALVLLGAGAAVALNRDWVMQYFQVAPQSQPYQTYQNSTFGISLDYTPDWKISVDQAHSTIRFADTSLTGQANLTRAIAGGQVWDYLNQQATQLGMSGAKQASAVTIAGANWQVLRGTGLQSGATYTIVLYATQHDGHFYMLEFLAPQSSFARIEQNSFAHMRSTFRFL
jgi:hypothetical protein